MSSLSDDADIVDRFEEFYRTYYRNEIGELARKFPGEQRSLYVDWTDLYRFDPDLAEDFKTQPDQMREYAEEALRVHDLPVDVKLGAAHVRVRNLGGATGIREIRADHVGRLIAIQGIVRKATGVRPRIQQAAFECQRCGTLTRVPQSEGDFQEPHECQGCERQGPFSINFDQSEFVDAQKIRVQESPEGLRGGETPEAIDVHIEDDITGEVTAGDHVTVTGVLHLEQQGSGGDKSAVFDFYMAGRSVTIEDEQFEEMEITDEDKREIVELSNDPEVYERMVGSLAPSIHGFDREKLSIILQLFSGVTKRLPDESRVRGDLHILLIGDPGTGKCVAGDTRVRLAGGRAVPIRELVERRLENPIPVDDGVYEPVAIDLPSMTADASILTRRATKVWKREAPHRMYRVRTAGGRELELTPSHPLFVQSGLGPTPARAEALSEGTFVAVPRREPVDGAARGGEDGHDDGEGDSSDRSERDPIPGVADALDRIRATLDLPPGDCGLPQAIYRRYERGDEPPSREHLRAVVDAFDDRIAALRDARDRSDRAQSGGDRRAAPAAGAAGRTGASRREAPGAGAGQAEVERAREAARAVRRLRRLVEGDLAWDRIEAIERVAPADDWVYDLEVEGTHSYLSNGIVSHNSKLLQYVRNLAPRSVYTSGKGSSSAGLCVAGDTLVHTDDGFREIRAIAKQCHPEPVAKAAATEHAVGLHTFDRERGSVDRRESSHAWRMPEKPCRRIETAHGKRLEASVDTPLLVCGEDGLEWRAVSEIEPGDSVAVPSYDGIDRTEVPVREFLEFTDEKLRLTDESIAFLRDRLRAEYGTLRDAAGATGLPEDFIYDSLSNRFLPIDRLRRLLDAVGATTADVDVRRAMLRHGDDVRLPEAFDEDLLYLVGLVFGDGDIRVSRRGGNRGMVRISNGDEALLRRAANIIREAFDYEVEIERQDGRVPSIRIHSATVARLLSSVGMETPKDELRLDPRLTTAAGADAFLRGLFDADGSVSVRDEGGSSVLLSTISEGLARQVQLMLETYGVRARVRERDRRGTSRLADGRTIESKRIQHHVEIQGRDIDAYADAIGFESAQKRAALDSVVRATNRRGETVPVGEVLTGVDTAAGEYHTNLGRGDDPGRSRARSILEDLDLKDAEPLVEEAVEADLRWDEVVAAVDTGETEVFDLTVPGTHNFLGNGIVTHNTAAAVRDEFSDGQQWSLEAGALVLADQGIAAIDELDKMRCVTGDTAVRTDDGEAPIASIAAKTAASGTVESLPNGRTIREFETTPTVRTMTGDGRLCWRPVTAVHEYDAPDRLYRVTLETGSSLVATPDHPFFVASGDGRTERPASELRVGDEVTVPDPRVAADGGSTRASDPGAGSHTTATAPDVTTREVSAIEVLTDHDHDAVYDLTVAGTHNFLANGMVVHNSEDQSAMHEALEQQSYHPDTEILLADGRRVSIGDFVDERMAAEPDGVVDGVECEILPVDDVAVHSLDFETNEPSKLPVDRVSRHEAPDEFVRVRFSNGREVLVTPEHPMFVDDEGETGTVPARRLEPGTFVPAPRKLPNSNAPVDLDDESRRASEKDVTLPDRLTEDLAELLGLLVAEGHSHAGSAHEVGFSNTDERLLERAGDLARRTFDIEARDTTNAVGTVTKRWISTKLYRWFETNFPGVMATAREKRIPARVLGASEEHVRRFLVGAFAGDGGVESEAMSIATTSAGLAEDYADALAKLGIATRIQHDPAEDSWKTYVMGDSNPRFVDLVVDPADDRYAAARAFADRSAETPRHHDVLPTSAVREIRELRRLVGAGLTGRFRSNLDEGFGVRIGTVEDEVATLRDRISGVETALSSATGLAAVRDAIGWSGRQLAERLGVTTSRIHYAESGGYDAATRWRLTERAREAVRAALDEAERRVDALESRCELRYLRVTDVETVPNDGEHATDWVYDVTVEPTNTFVSKGIALHNSISISKAGINATLKSRCSLLGAANPIYGRFDEYEPFAEQIDLEPPLISRFDLIFTVTDEPDEEADRDLAEHIIKTNYAGELRTHRAEAATSNVSAEQVEAVTSEVEPAIEPELLRKYVAYAKRNCYPTMTEEAKDAIREFYVDLRLEGQEGDTPVPITARKLEALVRLAEASARVRLSDTVEAEDAERVIDVVRSSLEDVGVDPETGELDADVIESGTSKSQRDRIKNIKGIIEELENEYDEGAPVEAVIERAGEVGMDETKAEHEIQKLKNRGDIYEPSTDHLRTV